MKVAVLMLCVGLLLTWGAPASGQQDGTPQKESPMNRAAERSQMKRDTLMAPELSAPEAVGDSGPRTLAGKIVSVDPAAGTITIVMRHRKVEKTFSLDPYATIMAGDKEVELEDLQAGKKVTLVYWVRREGNIVIAIRSSS